MKIANTLKKPVSYGISLLLLAGGASGLSAAQAVADQINCDSPEKHTTTSISEAQQHQGYQVHQQQVGETVADGLNADQVEELKKQHPGLVVLNSRKEKIGIPGHVESLEFDNLTSAQEIEAESKLADLGYQVVEINGGGHFTKHGSHDGPASEIQKFEDKGLTEAAGKQEIEQLTAMGFHGMESDVAPIKLVDEGTSIEVPDYEHEATIKDDQHSGPVSLDGCKSFQNEWKLLGYTVSDCNKAFTKSVEHPGTPEKVSRVAIPVDSADDVRRELEAEGYTVTVGKPYSDDESKSAGSTGSPTAFFSQDGLTEEIADGMVKSLIADGYLDAKKTEKGSHHVGGGAPELVADPTGGKMTEDEVRAFYNIYTDKGFEVKWAPSTVNDPAHGIKNGHTVVGVQPTVDTVLEDGFSTLEAATRRAGELNKLGYKMSAPEISHTEAKDVIAWGHNAQDYYDKNHSWLDWKTLVNMLYKGPKPAGGFVDRTGPNDHSPNVEGRDIVYEKIADYDGGCHIRDPKVWSDQLCALEDAKIIDRNVDLIKFERGDYIQGPNITGWTKSISKKSVSNTYKISGIRQIDNTREVQLYTASAKKENPGVDVKLFEVSGSKTVRRTPRQAQFEVVDIEGVKGTSTSEDVQYYTADAHFEMEKPQAKKVERFKLEAERLVAPAAPSEELVFDIAATKYVEDSREQEVFNAKWANNQAYYTYETQNCHQVPTETPKVQNASFVKELPKTGVGIAALLSILAGLLLLGLTAKASVIRRVDRLTSRK